MFKSAMMVVGIVFLTLTFWATSAERASAREPLRGGQLVVGSIVCTLPPALNVRLSPGYIGKGPADVVNELPQGMELVLLTGPVFRDGIAWWYIDLGAWGNGWVAETADSGARMLGFGGCNTIAASPQSRPNTGGIIVNEGDTLGRLATRHGTTVVDLMRTNALVNSRLSVGQILWMAGNSTRYGESRVLGDVIALDTYSSRFEVLQTGGTPVTVSAFTADVAHAAGGIASIQSVVPGTTVEIFGTMWGTGAMLANRIYLVDWRPQPVSAIAWPAVLVQPSAALSARRHVVAPGETLYGLAARYGTTIAAIQRANSMAPSTLEIRAYETIQIP